MRTHRTPYRRLLPSVLLAAVLFIAAGCIRDSVADPAGEGSLTLLFATSDNAETSTRSPSEDAYNENLISRAKLFFFNDQSAVLADDTPATYAVTLTGIGARTTHAQTLKINRDTRSAIFGTGTKSHVIAAVNLPANVTIPDNATPADIRAAVISANFKPLKQEDFAMLGQSVVTFIDAEEKNALGTVNLYRAAAKIRLAADIEATVAVPNPDAPDDPTQSITWHANTEGIRLWFINGVDNAHLDGSPLALTGPTNRHFFHTSPGGTADLSAAGEDYTRQLTLTSGFADYPYWNEAPLYSYAHAWENTPGEMHRTRLVVLVPWQKDGEPSWTNTYYTVPLNVYGGTATDDDGTATEILPNSLAANTYYLVKLHIGMLGSFIPDESVELEPTYEIADWRHETLDANIADNRFLVVNQTEWVMNNTADLEIPFLTSHKTTVLRTEMYYWHFDPPLNSALKTADYYTFYNNILDYCDFVKNYGSYSTAVNTGEYAGVPLLRKLTDTQNDASTDADGEHIWQATIPDDQPVIQFHHDMHLWRELDDRGEPLYSNTGGARQDNRYLRETARLERTRIGTTNNTDTMHVSRIDFFITIVHEDLKDDPTTRFQETVHIIQYPGIYIEPSYNAGDPQSNRDLGYVYVNAFNGLNEQTQYNHWINVPPLSHNQNNRNPNMYVININQLDANYPSYNIGDPRILTSNINLSDASFKGTVRPDTRWTRRNTVGSQAPVDAPSWSNGTEGARRTIQNYYPTDIATGPGSKENFVAPRIRVASSYGRSNAPVTEEDARIRCAAYQEFGYPAGRWRVPTKSEVEFIALLSTNDRIPVLFTPWGDEISTNTYVYAYYMTAQGYGYVNGLYKGELNGFSRGEVVLGAHPRQREAGINSTPAPAVRCVYDEWYWNKVDGTPDRMPESQYRIFHWGDKEKDDPQKGSM